MKKHLWILSLAALTAAYSCSEDSDLTIPPFEAGPEVVTPEDPEKPEDPEADEPEVLFFDDFDGKRVSPRRWRACPWKTPLWCNFLHFSLEDHVVEDGYLKLRAVDPMLHGGELTGDEIAKGYKFHAWTYGIDTRGIFGFRYGEIQVRAKFNRSGPGAWPAIWLMPVDEHDAESNPNGVMWPEGGEIDIMERWDERTNFSHAIHYKSVNGTTDRSKTKSVTTTTANVNLKLDDFNTYGVRKSPDKLEFIVNGVITQTYTRKDIEQASASPTSSLNGKWPFEDRDFYIILNHACASTSELGLRSSILYKYLPPPPTSDLPYEMLVDWVKVTALPKEAETPAE